MDNRVRTGARGAVFVYVEILLTRAIAFLIPILLVRNLTKEEYGLFVLIPSLALIVAYVSSFGLEDVFSRYVPEYLKTRSPRRVNRLFLTVAGLRLAVLAVVLGLMFVFQDTLAQLLKAPPLFEKLAAWVLVFIGLTRFTYLIGDNFVSACGQRHYVSVVRIVIEAVRLGFLSLAILLHGGIYGVVLAMCAYRVVELIIYGAIDARKFVANVRRYADDTSPSLDLELRRLLRFGSLSFFARGLHGFRNITIDNLVIAYFLGPVAVAGYGLAAFFPNLTRSFAPSRMLTSVVQPMMVSAYVENPATPFLPRMHAFLQKLNLFLIVPLSAGAMVMAEKIIVYIFRPDYADVVGVIYVLVATLFFTTLTDAFFLLCEILERKEITLIASVFSLYNLVMDIVLIPGYGIMGAAVATGSASVLLYVYIWLVFRYSVRMPLRFPFAAAARIVVNTVVMLVPVVMLLSRVGSATSVIALALGGAAVYFAVSYANKPFSREEREMINNNLPKPWFVF